MAVISRPPCLVGPDHVGDHQAAHRAIRHHLGAPAAKHEVTTGVEHHINVLGTPESWIDEDWFDLSLL